MLGAQAEPPPARRATRERARPRKCTRGSAKAVEHHEQALRRRRSRCRKRRRGRGARGARAGRRPQRAPRTRACERAQPAGHVDAVRSCPTVKPTRRRYARRSPKIKITHDFTLLGAEVGPTSRTRSGTCPLKPTVQNIIGLIRGCCSCRRQPLPQTPSPAPPPLESARALPPPPARTHAGANGPLTPKRPSP